MHSKETASNQQITGKALLEVLPICGICGKTLSGHFFKHLAETPIEKDNADRAKALLAALERCDWSAIQSFQEFNGLLDVMEVYDLKCPDGRCSVAACISRFELNDVDTFLHQQPASDFGGFIQNYEWSLI